jgi:NADP-dependent 3-hydroxy acid dehydrogenase YdfG
MVSKAPRVVWITGASSGIGKALARAFAHRGDLVVLSARRKDLLHSIARSLQRNGASVQVLACDVRNDRELRQVAQKILRTNGHVDVLVNNAGVTSFKDFRSTTIKEFDAVLETNLRGAFIATRAVLPSMMKRKKGLIVNIISYAAKTTYTNSAAYSASKAGTEAMMNVLRAETRKDGIKVVNVYPGAVLTPMWRAKHRARYSAHMISANDVAHFVCNVTTLPEKVMVEEIIIRPQKGDLRI